MPTIKTESESVDKIIRCYALVNKIPGDNYTFLETLPRDIFHFGSDENAVLIDVFESSMEGDIPAGDTKEIQISLWAKHKEGSQMQGGSAVLAFCDRYIPEVEFDFVRIGEIYVGVGIRVRSTSDEMREFIDDIEIRILDANQP